MGKKVKRLYEQFQPEHYDLVLDVDRDNMKFSGEVTIRGKKVGRPTERLTFHQKGLKISQASIKSLGKNPKTLNVTRINNQNSYDEVRLHTNSQIFPGEYVITLEFSSEITRPMNGIYPCYFKEGSKDKMLIATQFESHHAREAFPCVDEPEAKATFDLTLTSPAGETVLSNTPVNKLSEKGKKQTNIFETTPKMSTYLLAFAFGDVDYLESKTKSGVIVRAYATKDKYKHTKFALDVAVKTLDFYNEYFDIPYPLAKCDFIALPDFASGAMENWGLITFREQVMLYDPKNTSLHIQQYIANVVAHELTHQWFGNLVTMRWWTDLWLNESFASWMSWLAIDHLFPKWKVWTQFIVDEQGVALKLDALENTHPIEVEVKHPDEIRTIFDAISYEKGASVLLMLEKYLGADDFRDGLRLYLKRHAYANTDTIDLWAALEEVSKKPVKEFMAAWTSKSGYPLVQANITERKLSQERFYLNPKAKKESAVWPIPLMPNADFQPEILNKAKQSITKASPKNALILNHKRTSFYRVCYDSKHLKLMAKAVKTQSMDELDRLGLLSDAIESAKAGYYSTIDVLELLDAYKNESSTVVWDVIAGVIGSIRIVMDDDATRDVLKPYIRDLIQKQLKRLGWQTKKSDSHFDRLLRPTILGLASYGEDPSVIKEARKRFDSMKKPEDIHPDLRGVVYGTIARTGNAKDFDKMLKMHDTSANSEERLTLAGALTGFEQPSLYKRALKHITSDEVRLQDAPYWIAYSFGNRHARKTTWQWMKDNWDWLAKNLGNDLSFFRMPLYAGRNFSDAKFLPEFNKFFETHMSPAFERSVKQAIETIGWQSAWKDRDHKNIKDFLKSNTRSR